MIKNEWYKDLLQKYDADFRSMQFLLLQKSQNEQNQTQRAPPEPDNNMLIHELIKKKTQIGDLEKKNNHLAEEYVKAKGKFHESRPARVLEEMVKNKNEVKNKLIIIKGNCNFKITY